MSGHTISLEYDTELTRTSEDAAIEFLKAVRSGKQFNFTVFNDDGGETSLSSSDIEKHISKS